MELVVTDEDGLSSAPDEVLVSSDNLAPTAAAAPELLILGETAILDGSGSTDPEGDVLAYCWTLTLAPAGSTATLVGAGTVTASIIPDVEGVYQATLVVSDFIGPGTPATVSITATTANDFAEIVIVDACDIVSNLPADQVTTKGNQLAMCNDLSEAIRAIQNGHLATAIRKVEDTIDRTDGCVLRGNPDGNGPGRDWITDCVPQTDVHGLLTAALDALTN